MDPSGPRRGLAVVTVVFTTLDDAGWGLARQMDDLVEDLPGYRDNIRRRLPTCGAPAREAPVEKLQETMEDIKKDIGTEPRKDRLASPL